MYFCHPFLLSFGCFEEEYFGHSVGQVKQKQTKRAKIIL